MPYLNGVYYHLRYGLLIFLLSCASAIEAQQSIELLRDSANSLSNDGKFVLAAQTFGALSQKFESQGAIDSTTFYLYKSLHHYGLSGQNEYATNQYELLLTKLEEKNDLPRFMSKIYYSNGSNYLYQNNFDNALKNLQKAIDFELSQEDTDTTYLAKATEWKGLTTLYAGDIDKAIDLIQEAAKLLLYSEGPDSKNLGYTLNSLGLISDENNQLSKADSAFTEALRILRLHLPEGHAHLSSVSANISNIKVELGQFHEARQMLEDAIAIHKREELYDPLMKEYFNLGALYLSMDDVNRGIPYILKAIAIADSLYPDSYHVKEDFLNGLGSAYFRAGDYEKADSVFNQAFRYNTQFYDDNHPEIGQNYYNLGLIAQAQKHFEESREYYQKSFEIRLESYGKDNAITTDSYYGLGEVEWEIGIKEKAFQMLKSSYHSYKDTYGATHQSTIEAALTISGKHLEVGQLDSAKVWLNTTWADISGGNNEMYDEDYQISFSDSYVLHVIEFHLKMLIQTEAEEGQLLWIIDQMEKLIEILWPILNFENQHTELANRIKSIYSLNVLLAHRIGIESKDLQNSVLNALSESRYSTIRSAIQNRRAMQFANVPDSVVVKDRALRERIRFIKAKQRQEGDDKWQELAFEAVDEWRLWQRELENQYPKWHGIRYSQNEIDCKDFQKTLGDQTFLGYTMLDSICIAIVVSKSSFSSMELDLDDLDSSIRSLNEEIFTQGADESLAEICHSVYKDIFKPLEEKLSNDLLIMPDGPLHYMSFESLLTDEPEESNLADWPWLIKKYKVRTINMFYGSDLLTRESKSSITAFVPGFENSIKEGYKSQLADGVDADSTFLSWVRTPWSTEMVKSLPGSTHIFLGEKANETNFRKEAANASLLHFGTHAVLMDEKPLNSFLVLTPEPLEGNDGYVYAYELYNQPISANLALLTACETGLGAYSAGEGVLSLGHAFRYAGCPSVIYSLWKIDDQQSSAILIKFYEMLEEGKSYSDALREAKLEYLSTAPEELSSPYYWSGIVLSGAEGKLHTQNPNWVLVMGSIFLILILGFIVYRHKRRVS